MKTLVSGTSLVMCSVPVVGAASGAGADAGFDPDGFGTGAGVGTERGGAEPTGGGVAFTAGAGFGDSGAVRHKVGSLLGRVALVGTSV